MIDLSVVEQGIKDVMAKQVTDKKWTWFVKSKPMVVSLMMV